MINEITNHPKRISYHAIPGLLQNKNLTTKRISIQEIAEAVGQMYGIDVEMMKRKTRLEEIRFPRQIVMHIAVKVISPNYTTSETGRFFNLDHATAIHAGRVIKNRKDTDKKFHYKFMQILEILKL